MDILIIEDNTEIATNIGEYLNEKGHTSDYAANRITGAGPTRSTSRRCGQKRRN